MAVEPRVGKMLPVAGLAAQMAPASRNRRLKTVGELFLADEGQQTQPAADVDQKQHEPRRPMFNGDHAQQWQQLTRQLLHICIGAAIFRLSELEPLSGPLALIDFSRAHIYE